MSLLEMKNVTAFYGAAQALFDVNLTVNEGQVVALLGRNGMGKSTSIKCLFGMVPLRQGSIVFDGQQLGAMASHKIARLGLGLVPEGRRVFARLNVFENLMVAARPGYWDIARVGALFPRLLERKAQNATTLSGGEQQMLAIGRALMTNARLLVLDEATEGLAPILRQEIWAAIAAVKKQTGLSILVVDKSIAELRAIADHAVVLQRGATVWQGPMAELTSDITNKYVGV